MINYSENKQVILDSLINELRKNRIGTEISTGWLCRKIYGSDISEEDMMEIDFDLYKEASKNGITLSKEKYRNMALGLPHHIPYTIVKIRKQK